jgi:DNA-binding CsgD family transcriptional regulator
MEHKLDNDFKRPQLPVFASGKLTLREQEVLALLARGFLYKEIQHQLGISENTVRYHLKLIYRKLQVGSRKEASAIFPKQT